MMESDFFSLQGLCIPPDIEQIEGERNTEFVNSEGGGLDDGQGTKNVSKEVEPSSLVSHSSYYYSYMYVVTLIFHFAINDLFLKPLKFLIT